MREFKPRINQVVMLELQNCATFSKAQPQESEEVERRVKQYLKQTVSGQDYPMYLNYFKTLIENRPLYEKKD